MSGQKGRVVGADTKKAVTRSPLFNCFFSSQRNLDSLAARDGDFYCPLKIAINGEMP